MENQLRVGLAGLGAIGHKHCERLNQKLQGATVVAVTDPGEAYGREAAKSIGLPFFPDIGTLLDQGGVDALIVTAGDEHHESLVTAALTRGKPVFCEKPLAPTAAACQRVIAAEMAAGKRLVQVGFMRRYDDGYRQLKKLLDSGLYGAPLLVHAAHRNFSTPDYYDTPMVISNTLIHEIDILRWLIGEDYVAVEVALGKQSRFSPEKLRDPQIMVLYSKSGIRLDVEAFMNSQTGYDIQCEVVCEEGVLRLPALPAPEIVANANRLTSICRDWSERFPAAYDSELQAWINATRAGKATGPSAWDGYLACLTADQAHQARESQQRVPIVFPPCPAFYQG
ncbi:MAG: Gfo/Idh/MocA family oxidoreductase [Planctomycetota bacterium]|jgi:myo-inositol 2-dehydrogenase/D-chiro-inositol 1-dehydrogenase|nr:Gfo/Idh/MocA family oxidoreductase [Planctomycetota bacterium]